MTYRIAFGGFLHETNTFGPSKAGLDAFETGSGWPPLGRGEAVFETVRDVNVGAAGFVLAARARGWTLLPTLWAAATPSAHVAREAFETITGDLLARLEAHGPVDAVYLDLHGAMVAEHVDDGEGEILARVRAAIGPDVPLVASLDLHGNVTARMVEAADALVAYRTYPHVDMADTGRRTADYLAGLLADGCRDAKAFRQLPFLIPIAWQATAMEPCRTIYARLAEAEGAAVPTLSFLPGFPAADFPDCGPSVVAYGRTQAEADAAADAIAALVADSEGAFTGRVLAPDEGVREAMAIAAQAKKPVVISDTQDNPGAGGDSDTMGMVRALVEAGATRAAIGTICDPAAAEAAHAAGEGATVRLALGARSRIPGDAPYEAEYVVERLSDGRFVAPGPFYGGARMNLGPSACLRVGDVRVVVASRKAQMADRAMYRQVGIEPEAQAILVNKSSVHFRADFEPIAEAILVCAAPGPMPVDPSALPWRRLRPGLRTAPNGPVFGQGAAMDLAALPLDVDTLLAGLAPWITCESPTFDAAAVSRMMEVAGRDLAAAGAAVERIPGPPGLGDCLRAQFPHPRQGEPGILVMAHLDTVHPVGTLAALPFRRDGERVYGPGILDMKGGAYAALAAISALARAGVATPLPVHVLLTCDEEIGSPGTRDLILSEARRHKAVLVPEPGRPGNGVVTGRYAIARFGLTAQGRPSHAGAALKDGRSAVSLMARELLDIEAMSDDDCTVSVGVIHGGQWVNCVPTHCRAEALSMAKRQADLDRSVERMLARTRVEADGSRLTVERGVTRPVWEPNAGTMRLYELAKSVAAELGFDLPHGSAGGGSDANFTGAAGIPSLDGLGLLGAGYHTLDEHILVESLPQRIRLMAGLLARLS